jgi:hypothetical protein
MVLFGGALTFRFLREAGGVTEAEMADAFPV